MEDFKDVMLAEPPARFAAAPMVHPTSLESYKGILLCGRPSDGARVRDQGPAPIPFLPAGRPDDARYLGLQPSMEERARLELQRSTRQINHTNATTGKRGAILSKHKRWLVSFAQAVRTMKDEQQMQLESQKEKMQRLREREAESRRNRSVTTTGGDNAAGDNYNNNNSGSRTGSSAPGGAASEGAIVAAATTASATNNAPAAAATTTTRVTSTKMASKKKPKWALTEEEAMDEEFAEARDLIDFAASLDFNKFMQDYEVREALAIMRDRVKEIAQSEGIDLDAAKAAAANDDDDAVTVSTEGAAGPPPELSGEQREAWFKAAEDRRQQRRAARRSTKQAQAQQQQSPANDNGNSAAREAGWDRSVSDRVRTAVSSEALRLADKVLASSDAMRKVHSRQSLARLLQDAALSPDAATGGSSASVAVLGGSQDAALATSIGLAKESWIEPPKVTTYAAEAIRDQSRGSKPAQGLPEQRRVLTEMRKATDKAQNLPYLYRCPSI